MSDYIEITAKTVDDAITEALIKLETTSDKIEYEVIEKGIRRRIGLLGESDFFGKLYHFGCTGEGLRHSSGGANT